MEEYQDVINDLEKALILAKEMVSLGVERSIFLIKIHSIYFFIYPSWSYPL